MRRSASKTVRKGIFASDKKNRASASAVIISIYGNASYKDQLIAEKTFSA